LALALGIAQAHGGTLALMPSSAGACFRLTLPKAQAAVSAAPAPQTEAGPAPAASGARALVVDDEAPLREMLRRLLRRRGFAVDLAEDGRLASGLLQHHHYHVVFCDLQMPNMGGMALLDWMRTRKSLSSTFVLMTGGPLTPELQSAVDASHAALLAKPFDAAALDAVLQEAVTTPLKAAGGSRR
jgi:CheY-like chemotaxis protein